MTKYSKFVPITRNDTNSKWYILHKKSLLCVYLTVRFIYWLKSFQGFFELIIIQMEWAQNSHLHYLTELSHCRHCTLFSSLADRLVGVTARSTDRPRLAGDWGFPLVGVSALDLAGEAVLVRAGDRVFLSAVGGDFRTFLLRLRERLFDRLLDEDLDVDLLPCETQFNKGFI